jgi:ATP-binding cassette subfamily B (MDR/TAP) protein 1
MVDEQGIIEDDEEFNKEKEYMERAAEDVRRNRRRVNSSRKRWDTQPETESPSKQNKKLHRLKGGRSKSGAKTGGKDEEPTTPIVTSNADSIAQIPFFKLMRLYWPTIPQKPIYILGLIFALISGAATPVFGFFLSRLVVEITGATYDSSTLNRYGVYVLLLAILNGVSTGIKYYLIEYVTAKWLRDLRQEAFAAIVRQDKSWFDKPINTPSQLLQLVMRDPEDARAFLALVIPQGLVVSSMIGTGLIWALAVGWQLTLVGLALGPLFVFFSSVQNHFAGKFERRNKTKREEVNGKYYDTVANVRAIRAMGFEAVFKEQFERTLENAMKAGVNGGFVDGLSYGIANALIYGAQGLFSLINL